MLRRTVELERFLRSVAGTEPLVEYCERRGIPLVPRGTGWKAEMLRRWNDAVLTLSPEAQADIELEIAQVQALANRESLSRLFDVCDGRSLPSDLVPGEAAQALHFLVHHPSVFREVYFQATVMQAESWQNAAAPPGITIADPERRRAGFEAALARFFRVSEGTGRFVASQSFSLDDPACFVFIGYVSDRLRLLDAFTERGVRRYERHRPASPVIFAYYPADGAILIKCRQRAREKVLALLRAFARTVLETDVDERTLGVRFDLDRLAQPFEPTLPEGVAAVRVRALEFAYPASDGRRRLRLATNAHDRRSAIQDLLDAHVGPGARERLRVIAADLQVTLLVRGRPKNHVVRLWPGRSNLDQSAAGETLRRCLRDWGLTRHAQES